MVKPCKIGASYRQNVVTKIKIGKGDAQAASILINKGFEQKQRGG
jgi:hypothetical protein